MAKGNTSKKKADKPINIENILFNCRDILRQARNSGSLLMRERKDNYGALF